MKLLRYAIRLPQHRSQQAVGLGYREFDLLFCKRLRLQTENESKEQKVGPGKMALIGEGVCPAMDRDSLVMVMFVTDSTICLHIAF